MSSAARLSPDLVACWVIKSRTPPEDISPGWSRGATRELRRCVRRSYRVELMLPGQRCLMWLSGRDGPGVRAIGTLRAGAEVPEGSDPARPDAMVTAAFYLLMDPVPRASWLADHELAGAEVIRMPAGSNPSYLDAQRWKVLRTLLSPRDLDRAG